MELFVIFIIMWLVSPVVLGIVCGFQAAKINKLKAHISALENTVNDSGHTDKLIVNASPLKKDIPEQIYGTSPVPAYSYTAAPSKECAHTKENALPKQSGAANLSSVIMILGALFITLAGFVFAAAAWGNLSIFFKSAVLVSFSALFFVMHFIAAKKLRLETAGKVFFVLGSVLLTAAAAAAGMLRLFGRYFSFFGEGRALVFMVMFLLPSCCFFVGAHIYKSGIFAKTAYSCLAAAEVSFILYMSGHYAVICTAAGLISLLMTAFEPKIKKLMGGGPVGENFRFFAVLSTWSAAAASLIISEGSVMFILPAVLLASSFFAGAARSDKPLAGVTAFVIYLIIGVLRGIAPRGAEGYILTVSAVTVVFALMGMTDIFGNRITDILRRLGGVCSSLLIASAFIYEIADGGLKYFETPMLISAAVIFIQSVLSAFKEHKNKSGVLAALTFLWLSFEAASLVYSFPSLRGGALCVMGAMLFAYMLCTVCTPLKLLHFTGLESAVCVILLICMLCVDSSLYGCGEIIFLWLLSLSAALFAGRHGGAEAFLAPIAAFAVMYPVYTVNPFKVYAQFRVTDAFSVTAVIYCLFACACIFARSLKKYLPGFSFGIPVLCLLYIFITEGAPCIAVPAAITVFAAAYCFEKAADGRFNLYASFFLFMLCADSFELGRTVSEGTCAFIFPAAVLVMISGIFILAVRIGKSPLSERIGTATGGFLSAALPVYAMVLMFIACDELYDAAFYPGLILAALGCAAAVITKKALLSYICCASAYFFSYSFLNDTGINMPWLPVLGLALVSCAAGRLIFGKKLMPLDKPLYGDFLSLTSVAAVAVCITGDGGKYAVWFGLAMAVIWALNLVRRENGAGLNKGAFTAAALLAIPFWNAQPFIHIPQLFKTEWSLIPAAMFCVFAGFIYRDKPKTADAVSFVCAVICMIILFISAYDSGYAADAVILGAVIGAVLLASFILKRKKWFVLGVACAAAEALFLTLRLINSRTWWIYLLAAGVVLVALGTVGEIAKRRDTKKTKKIFSDWRR